MVNAWCVNSPQQRCAVVARGKKTEVLTMPKKPEKLKKIPDDIASYALSKGPRIKEGNNYETITSYANNKVELIEWYMKVLKSNSQQYIVPHSMEYLSKIRDDILEAISVVTAMFVGGDEEEDDDEYVVVKTPPPRRAMDREPYRSSDAPRVMQKEPKKVNKAIGNPRSDGKLGNRCAFCHFWEGDPKFEYRKPGEVLYDADACAYCIKMHGEYRGSNPPCNHFQLSVQASKYSR
jgi:hypothetical protein